MIVDIGWLKMVNKWLAEIDAADVNRIIWIENEKEVYPTEDVLHEIQNYGLKVKDIIHFTWKEN